MGVRTVRLDDECEKRLADIQRLTRLSVSLVLKQGLILVRDQIRAQASARPFAVYESIALGEGGYAPAPARRAKTALPRFCGAGGGDDRS